MPIKFRIVEMSDKETDILLLLTKFHCPLVPFDLVHRQGSWSGIKRANAVHKPLFLPRLSAAKITYGPKAGIK